MARWKVIPVCEYKRQEDNSNFVLANRTIVAPHYVIVKAYNIDGTCKAVHPIKKVDGRLIIMTERVPNGEKISIEYYTVVKISK